MAKLRTNHSKQDSSMGGGTIVKFGLFSAIIAGLFFVFNLFTGKDSNTMPASDGVPESTPAASARYLPRCRSGQLIRHSHFSICYSEEYKQAEWVAYLLSVETLDMPWEKRNDVFLPDPNIRNNPVTPNDYRGSGYDRGHLVPAADMAFSAEAMQETFYMSNISPQSGNFNKGIWRELEELVRNWAKSNKQLYIATGPVLKQAPKGYIGDNEVAVPAAYYKVLLDLTEPQLKGIGFLMPNEVSYEPLFKYAVSIDEVEAATGIDFFPELMPKDLEADIESSFNVDLWPFNKKKYDTRVNSWNKQ